MATDHPGVAPGCDTGGMRIAVAGATGTSGRLVVAELAARGADVVPISRASGSDLLTGDGLADALAGVDAVIDASSMARPPAGMTMLDATTTAIDHLTAVATDAGVGRLVVLSIVGVDEPCFGPGTYYETKRVHEERAVASGLPTTVVRTTQWFEFATNPGAVRLHDDRVEVQDRLMQPVAAAAVATVLVDRAMAADLPAMLQVAGPARMLLSELTAAVLRHVGDDRPVVAVDPPTSELLTGVLLPPDDALIVGPSLDDWLARVQSLDDVR